MKYLILSVLCAIFMTGCDTSEEEILSQAEKIKAARKAAKNAPIKIIKNEIIESYKIGGFGNGSIYVTKDISVIEYDGCEYVLYRDDIGERHGIAGLAHKGNCKYCLGKK